jgi:hydrogenase-4 component F
VSPALWLLLPLAVAPWLRVRGGRHAAALLVLAAIAEVTVAALIGFELIPGTLIASPGELLTTDPTARLFLLVIDAIFVGITTSSWLRRRGHIGVPDRGPTDALFALIFLVAANLAVVTNHVLLAWLALEVTTLAAAPMIVRPDKPGAIGASWRYVLFSTVGLSVALLGLLCLARGHGGAAGCFFDELARGPAAATDPWRPLGVALVVLGIGTKLGLAPMYTWLPEAYDEAPSGVVSMMAAVQFNCALVVLLRVLQMPDALAGPAPGVLFTMGLASMVVSAASILATRNIRRLLAYASINHAGVIAIGLALGGPAAYGVLLYAVSNAFIKAILFISVGKMEHHYQSKDMRDVGGLIKDLPYTGLFLMVGTFALLGFPPFGSFLGELLILSSLSATGQMLVFAGFCVAIATTFVATGRSVFPMIWSDAKRKATWPRQTLAASLPKLAFMAALVMMGIWVPPQVNELFRAVAAALGAH